MLTLLLFAPDVASAHAHLKRSVPSAGAQVNVSPQALKLWFSEEPDLSLTFVSLRDSTGATIPLGQPEREASAGMAITIRLLRPIIAGRYKVTWRTAAADGHPSNGTFSFEVLASQSPSHTTTVSHDTVAVPEETDPSASVGNSAARVLLFLGLLGLIGAIAFRLLVLPGAQRVSTELKERMSQRAALLGIVSTATVILAGVVRLNLESHMMNAMPSMPGMANMDMRGMVMRTAWGFAYRMQLLAALAALVGFGLALRRVSLGWFLATAAALVLAITPALSGHAAASPRFTAAMIAADWLHVLGGGAWLGSLLCVMTIAVPMAMTRELPERWSSIASIVNAFSRVALIAAGTVVASGVFAAWVHLEHVSDLWRTAYGETLTLKLVFVGLTFAIGAYNFKRVQPQLSTEVGTARLKRSATAELITGFVILVVTGFLTGVSL